MTRSSVELRIAGALSAFCLLAFFCFAVTDLNHPPGIRWVRLLAAAFVAGLGVLEFWRPSWGCAVALLAWPHWMLGRELLSRLHPHFAYIPDFHGGALAAALALAAWLRFERGFRSAQPEALPADSPALSVRIWNIALWVLVASSIVSVLLFYWRVRGGIEGWVIDAPNYRQLLSQSPTSSAKPFLRLIDTVPPLLWGVIHLQLVLRHQAVVRCAFVLKAMALSGVLIGFHVLIQLYLGALTWHWPYDGNPPGGPLYDRNVVAPVLVLFAAGSIALAIQTQHLVLRAGLFAGAATMVLAAALSGSRNGLFCIFAMGVTGLLIRPTVLRVAIAVALPLVLLLGLWYAPLPNPAPHQPTAVQRTIESVQAFRSGNWGALYSQRNHIYASSLDIWKERPVLGSGLGTLAMQVHHKARHNGFSVVYGLSQDHSHSLPLQLLAEQGVMGAAGWIAAFLIVPFVALLRWRTGGVLAWSVLLAGLSNQLDMVWLVPGVAWSGLLLLVLAAQHPLLVPAPEQKIPG